MAYFKIKKTFIRLKMIKYVKSILYYIAHLLTIVLPKKCFNFSFKLNTFITIIFGLGRKKYG